MRKSIICILVSSLILLSVSCTAPTQPSAERDLQVASHQFNTITFDLAMRAKYSAMVDALRVVKTSENAEEREAALIAMSDIYSEVEFLLVQAERAQSLLRNGRQWVRSQRGIFNVLVEDIKEAKVRADAKDKLSTEALPLPE